MTTVVIFAAGTRGDVEPYAALGRGLREAGYDVRLATHERFAGMAIDAGLEHRRLPGDPLLMYETGDWRIPPLALARPAKHARTLVGAMHALLGQISVDDYEAACAGADVVIYAMTTTTARDVAARLGLPSLCAHCGPFRRTRAFPHPLLAPGLRLGRIGNAMSYPLGDRLFRAPLQEPLRPRRRARLGLPTMPLRDGGVSWPPFPVILGFSRALLPRPADWPAQLRITGRWEMPRSTSAALPDELDDFLDAGAAPVLIGFGSMRPDDPERLNRSVLEGVRHAGVRAVVQAGWADLGAGATGDDVMVVGDVDHRLLLPRVAAVIHHGGAGTVHAGLRAGRPTLVVPFVFDQRFWGERVAAIGAGPAPVPQYRLTPSRLADAIVALGDPSIRAAAAAVAGAMERENGVAAAVEVVDEVLLR